MRTPRLQPLTIPAVTQRHAVKPIHLVLLVAPPIAEPPRTILVDVVPTTADAPQQTVVASPSIAIADPQNLIAANCMIIQFPHNGSDNAFYSIYVTHLLSTTIKLN